MKLIKPFNHVKDPIGYVIYYFESGAVKVLGLKEGWYRHHGVKHNGERPVIAELVGEVSDEVKYAWLCYVLHPEKGRIV